MPNRRHLLVIVEERFFAACAPHLSADSSTSKRLTPHVQLVTCQACNEQIRRVRRTMTKS